MTQVRILLTLGVLLTSRVSWGECVLLRLSAPAERASVVFSGTVVNVATDPASEWPGSIVSFDVDRVWKGTITEKFVLYTFSRTAERFDFTAGTKYMVLAHSQTAGEREQMRVNSSPPIFVVGPCGDGTREFSIVSAAEIGELGSGHAPTVR